jgi:hypothetical protein
MALTNLATACSGAEDVLYTVSFSPTYIHAYPPAGTTCIYNGQDILQKAPSFKTPVELQFELPPDDLTVISMV